MNMKLAMMLRLATRTAIARATISRDDLEHWAERLDELGVPHSGVKNPGYTANAMLTFRDPDNIQLEFIHAG
jgi:hypothetical protein